MATWIRTDDKGRIVSVTGVNASNNKKRVYFDLKEIAREYAENGIAGKYKVLSDAVMEIIMTYLRKYFNTFEKCFDTGYGLYASLVDDKLSYIIYIHNGVNTNDSYLVKIALKRIDGVIHLDEVDKHVSKCFETILGDYIGNYNKLKFDLELSDSKFLCDITENCMLAIQKIDIPQEVFKTIYYGE